MASSSTIYKSIKLQPGEQFVLPPGATLIGASLPDDLDSVCEIPELEELNCYVASLATLTIEQSGADTVFWGHSGGGVSNGAAQVIGFTLSDIPTTFTGVYKNDDPSIFLDMRFNATTITLMIAEMIANGVAITNFATDAEPGDGDNGTITYVLIKTIPSVALNLRLLYSSFAPGTGTVVYEVPFFPVADVVAGDNNAIPACP